MKFDPAAIIAPFRMLPGLGRLAPGQPVLTPLRPGDPVLDAKLAVLRTQPSQALCASAGWDPRPALAALSAQAACDHPQAWTTTDRGGGGQEHRARLLGWSIRGSTVVGGGPAEIGACLRALPPHWRQAALLSLAFAEDFAVLEAADGAAGGNVPWLAVCLPSHWAPERKVGRSFAEIHAPVADNEALLRAAAALTRLVTGGERWHRSVWSVTANAQLDGHPLRHPAPRWPTGAVADEIGERAWLRSEMQTFLPVPGRRQALFTIRVELQRLRDVVGDPLDGRRRAAALHAAIASMSAAVLDYRGLTAARQPLLDWLAARSAAR